MSLIGNIKKAYTPIRKEKLKPLPRRGDRVDMVDLSKFNGKIIGFKDNKVKVLWGDKEKNYSSFESPTKLALVERRR